ncbi:MAG TPA: FAD-dependent oxidoreductase [Candidatus Dormibacteraeota bacterium]|nr:FAD-dependent oxidoreductase [Candidatus Dormibacteraeota bacterium]
MTRSVDVVVVGAGVIGASIAYHLMLRQLRVAIFDQPEAPLPPSASWASAGGVRSQGRDPREWGLALEASRRWPQLAEELGADTGFRATGHLHVVERPQDLDALRDRVRRERAAGLAVELVGEAELRELAPALARTAIAGAYSEGDGQADPRATTRALLSAARRGGGLFHPWRVDGLRLGAERVVGVTAGIEQVAAGQVVLAAGSWSHRLTSAVGLELPIEPRASQMLLTDAARPTLTPTVTAEGRALSLKQLPGGEFLIGGGWRAEIDPERHACRVLEESVRGSWETARALLPALAEQRVAYRWCGIEAQSPDGVPLIGPTGLPGLYLATGFSNHGFQLAPAVGSAVAAALCGERPAALAPLSPERFRPSA